MKKIYAVWARVKLIKKPDWLDEYRKKYNNPYEFHVTLKSPCFIDQSELTDIKKIVSRVIEDMDPPAGGPNYKIKLVFNKIFSDREDGSVMIRAEKNEELMDLQYKIRTALKGHGNYQIPVLEEYETNFKPHLTIAYDVFGDQFDKAVKDIKNDFECVGEIDEIVLSCVKENTGEEVKNPKNLTIYKL